MLSFYHSPQSRSTAILALIEEMNIRDQVTIYEVNISRVDGSGGPDSSNPHPEGKVPALVHDGVLITERGAIMAYLTTLFPESGLAPKIGTPQWGAYLMWLSWYQGVVEPVIVHQYAELNHPVLHVTFRGHDEVVARLKTALEKGPWLLGDTFSAADILLHSPYAWFPDFMPDEPLTRDWVARCQARTGVQKALQADAALVANPA